MKKLVFLISVFILGSILSGCPPETGTTTYQTIKTARALLYSFNENGIFPYLEYFNKAELGIGVYPDSIYETMELVQSYSFGNALYARSNPNQLIYTNAIESINIITLYDFDANHMAGSNINELLLLLDAMGVTTKIDINSLSGVWHHFKFSTVPQNDSLQFQITGTITNEGEFTANTELVILD